VRQGESELGAERQPQYEAPDLLTQLEDLLDQVWRSEADWRFNDRLDLALKWTSVGGQAGQ
jgi:hypothetical protein